jgi:glutathione S-transferase
MVKVNPKAKNWMTKAAACLLGAGLEAEAVKHMEMAYQRDKKTMLAPESLRRVHPLGKSPVLEVDGRILAESCAIIEIMTVMARDAG